MTQLERARAYAARQAEKLAASKKQVAIAAAKEREQARKAHNQRCYKVGRLAAEMGLFTLDDSTLCQLFALLAGLRELPNPVGMLDALLWETYAPTDDTEGWKLWGPLPAREGVRLEHVSEEDEAQVKNGGVKSAL